MQVKHIRISHPATLASLVALLLAFGSSLAAHAQKELLTNGDFETGTFAGWHVADQPNPADAGNVDHFYISTPGADTPPVDGISFPTAPNPQGGNFYAVSTADFPGAHALLQDFTVPNYTTSLNLSFAMFVNDQSGFGPIVDPSGLDYTTGGTFNDNQHARVDLLRAGAGYLSTAPADVLANFYLGVDPAMFDANGNLLPDPYTSYAFNLTPYVSAGGSYVLRFAEVDNLGAINVGVDNVKVLATQVTPEGGSLGLLAVGLLVPGTACVYRRSKSRV